MRPATLLLASAVLAAFVAGCQSSRRNPYPPRTAAEKEQYERAIEEKRIVTGMTRSEARKAWGKPLRKDKVRFRGEIVERWMYPFSEFYFDEWGRVIGIRGPG